MAHPNGPRKQRAAKLRETVTRGPSFSLIGTDAADLGFGNLTTEQRNALCAHFLARYRIWAGSWVLPEMAALMKE